MCQKRGPWIYKRVLWHQNPGLRVAVLQQEVSPSLFIPVVEALKAAARRVSLHSKHLSTGLKSGRNLIPSLQGHIHRLFTQTY